MVFFNYQSPLALFLGLSLLVHRGLKGILPTIF